MPPSEFLHSLLSRATNELTVDDVAVYVTHPATAWLMSIGAHRRCARDACFLTCPSLPCAECGDNALFCDSHCRKLHAKDHKNECVVLRAVAKSSASNGSIKRMLNSATVQITEAIVSLALSSWGALEQPEVLQALPALPIRAASPRVLSALAVKVQYADQSIEALLLLGRAGKMHSPANTTTIARFEKAVDLARNEAKHLDSLNRDVSALSIRIKLGTGTGPVRESVSKSATFCL